MTFGLDRDYTERVDRRRVWRNVAWFVALVVVLNVAVTVGSAIFEPSVEGPAGSSFVTEADGVAGWRELLQHLGRDTVRLRERVAGADLDRDTVALVVIQPEAAYLDGAYADAVERFVREGGHLVITSGNPIASRLLAESRLANGTIGDTRPLLPAAETEGVDVVTFDGDLFFEDTGPGVPLLTSADGQHAALATVVGEGRVVMISEKSAVTNRLLAVSDNAAFAVAVTGGRNVVFDEYLHGYGLDQGASALPDNLALAAGVILVGAVVWIWAVARRLGTPEQAGRAFPPARSEFVRSLGATLARSHPDERAYGELRRHGLDLLARMSGSREAAGRQADAVAARARVTGQELAALRQPVASAEDAVLVGAAVTKLQAYSVGKDA